MRRDLLVQNPRPDGYHLMMELFGCEQEKINSRKFPHLLVKNAVKKAGLTNLGSRFHQFDPQGVTGFTLLAQSHISLHTWPEYGYAAIDIFTCGNTVQPEKAARVLVKELRAKNHTVLEIQRGILNDD